MGLIKPSLTERLAALSARVPEAPVVTGAVTEVAVRGATIVISVDATRGRWNERLEAVRRINVRDWDAQARVWVVPLSQVPQVLSLVEKGILLASPEARADLDSVMDQMSATIAGSSAGTADGFTLNFTLPEGLALFPYQVAGVRHACLHRRCIIGDEMGLGKTLQAIAACVHAGVKRTVVVCPAIMWTKWQREVQRFFPGQRVLGVGSRSPSRIPSDVNFVVVGQDVLTYWAEALIKWAPGALVLDESHNFKTQGAQRTKAAKAIAAVIPADGLVLLLTGTAIQNRPQELIEQLAIIGRLSDIAGRRDPKKNFRYRYADGTPTGPGTPEQHQALLEALRATCYIRRNQAEVAPELPPIFRTEITVEDNAEALKVYEDMAKDLAAWFTKNLEPDEAKRRIASYARAEAMVRITNLRQQASLVKLPALAQWADDYSRERPLVIFAHHRAVIDGLVEVLGCPKIDGTTSEAARTKAMDQFQAGEHRAIVCATTAAGIGIDLYRADTVLFAEADWSPGRWQQAEYRVKRHGQEADKVLSIYARTTAETVDTWISRVVAKKWEAVEGINAGRFGEAMFDDDDSTLTGAVMDWLLGR